jgi:hypothetical protein
MMISDDAVCEYEDQGAFDEGREERTILLTEV